MSLQHVLAWSTPPRRVLLEAAALGEVARRSQQLSENVRRCWLSPLERCGTARALITSLARSLAVCAGGAACCRVAAGAAARGSASAQ